MERLRINLPKEWHYSTNIKVRVTDLNYGNHLANDKVLSLIHEARVCFLQENKKSEIDFFGSGLIQVDAQIVYKKQAFLGDVLTIFLHFERPSKVGVNIFYKITKDEIEVARAKTGLAFFDYQSQKLIPPSDEILNFFKITKVL